MKADQACIVIFKEKTAFRRYMICLFHVLDRLGSLRLCVHYMGGHSQLSKFSQVTVYKPYTCMREGDE